MRIYFDTCVLSSYLNGEMDSFLEYFNKDDPTLIVSDIHLKELNNAKEGGLIDEFYNLLKKIPFEYISISKDGSPEFSKPSVSELKIMDHSDILINSLEEKYSKLMHKMFGGQDTESFLSLFSNLKLKPEDLSEPNDDTFTKNFNELLLNATNALFEEATQEIEKVDGLTETESNYNEIFWDCLSIKGTQIGDIKGPDVIKQIWEKIGPEINKFQKTTIEEFFPGKNENWTTAIYGTMMQLSFL